MLLPVNAAVQLNWNRAVANNELRWEYGHYGYCWQNFGQHCLQLLEGDAAGQPAPTFARCLDSQPSRRLMQNCRAEYTCTPHSGP